MPLLRKDVDETSSVPQALMTPPGKFVNTVPVPEMDRVAPAILSLPWLLMLAAI
jgi:hypothetical protein